jgi:hypothetical protein
MFRLIYVYILYHLMQILGNITNILGHDVNRVIKTSHLHGLLLAFLRTLPPST